MTSSYDDLRAELSALQGMVAHMAAQSGIGSGDSTRSFIPAESKTAGNEIMGSPDLYKAVVARWWRPDGTIVDVDEQHNPSTDKLLPTWDWIRAH